MRVVVSERLNHGESALERLAFFIHSVNKRRRREQGISEHASRLIGLVAHAIKPVDGNARIRAGAFKVLKKVANGLTGLGCASWTEQSRGACRKAQSRQS